MAKDIQFTHLEDFGFLAVTGKDAQKFLQGYVTCDIADISPTMSGIGAICNLQGRMVTSFRIVAIDEGYLLRMDRALVPRTMEFLKKYIVFSKAIMQDASGELNCYGVIGTIDAAPGAPKAVARLDGGYIVGAAGDDRFEAWMPVPDWSPSNAKPIAPSVWKQREIDEGLAWVSPATSEEFLPQMFNYHRTGGVDFDKGCYLGQEIVARMQYRGALNRKLFRGEGTDAKTVGEALVDTEGKSVGAVVAAQGNTFLAVLQAKDDMVPNLSGCTLVAC